MKEIVHKNNGLMTSPILRRRKGSVFNKEKPKLVVGAIVALIIGITLWLLIAKNNGDEEDYELLTSSSSSSLLLTGVLKSEEGNIDCKKKLDQLDAIFNQKRKARQSYKRKVRRIVPAFDNEFFDLGSPVVLYIFGAGNCSHLFLNPISNSI